MTAKQVAEDHDEQPDQYDKREYREDIGQEIAKRKTFCEEQHGASLSGVKSHATFTSRGCQS
jgi:hypothetical protein